VSPTTKFKENILVLKKNKNKKQEKNKK